MDLFSFDSIMEFAKLEPGHGMLQSVLLFMIWLQSKGLRAELKSLRDSMGEAKIHMEERFEKVEDRLTILEMRGK